MHSSVYTSYMLMAISQAALWLQARLDRPRLAEARDTLHKHGALAHVTCVVARALGSCDVFLRRCGAAAQPAVEL